jgi:Flp pilus assembly protein TadG
MTLFKTVIHLLRDNNATAAAEMAMVMPFLIILMFGSFELGNYFYNEHIVVKAVRDGARYASHRPFTDYTGCGTPPGNLPGDVQTMTRTGQLAPGGTPLLANWTDNNTISVIVTTCDTSGTYSGIYNGQAQGALVVTVTATVPYQSILGTLGIDTTLFNLNATSQAAVMGI